MTAPTRVVVTGLGVISPLANDVDTFWRRLVAGESGVGAITRFDTTDFKVHIAAEVKDFDPEDYIDKRKVRRLDLFSRYAVAAAKTAAADADFDPSLEAERCGAVIGSGVGGLQTLQSEIEKLIEKGPDRTNPLLVPMMIPNMGAAHVSLELGTKGPLSATCTACAAGSDAIAYAARLIRARRRRSDVRRRQRGAHQPRRRRRLRRRPRAEPAQRRPGRRLAAVRLRPRRLRDRRGRRLPGAREPRARPGPRRPHLRRARRRRDELGRLPHDAARRDRPLAGARHGRWPSKRPA